jgi:hypothetical protein
MSTTNAAHERNSSSLLALRDLLLAIIRQPAIFAEKKDLFDALKSQGGMAKLATSFEDNGLPRVKEPMSINTLKTHANDTLERGFQGLDDLRKAALGSITSFQTRSESSNKRTKSGLSKRTEELEEKLQQCQRSNMILLQGLSLAMDELRNVQAHISPALLEKRAQGTVATLLALLSMNPSPFDTLPPMQGSKLVTELDDYRK